MYTNSNVHNMYSEMTTTKKENTLHFYDMYNIRIIWTIYFAIMGSSILVLSTSQGTILLVVFICMAHISCSKEDTV